MFNPTQVSQCLCRKLKGLSNCWLSNCCGQTYHKTWSSVPPGVKPVETKKERKKKKKGKKPRHKPLWSVAAVLLFPDGRLFTVGEHLDGSRTLPLCTFTAELFCTKRESLIHFEKLEREQKKKKKKNWCKLTDQKSKRLQYNFFRI